MSELPPTSEWPHYPLFIKPDPEACGGNLDVKGVRPHESCPIGIPFEFESDYFKGKILFRVRNLETSSGADGDTRYFGSCKKRLNQIIVQGRFKQEIAARDIAFGGEFKRRLKQAPPALIERIMNSIFTRINPGVKFALSEEKPWVLVNYPASAQTFRVDAEGGEPDISTCVEFEENNALLSKFNREGGGKNKKKNLSFPVDTQKRRKILRNDTDGDIVFDTEHVYTFEHYDDIMDYTTYGMDVKAYKFDMSKMVDHEPFQIMAKNLKDGKHLWSFGIWHEKLLEVASDSDNGKGVNLLPNFLMK